MVEIKTASRGYPVGRCRLLGLVPVLLFLGACAVSPDRGSKDIRYAPPPRKVMNDATAWYPDASKRARETGEVILHFHIGADGIAEEPFVVDDASTATPRLIDAAKNMFLRSRYEIGERYRHEVAASVLFEFMPCGEIHQAPGLDYYYTLCIPPIQSPQDAPHF